MSAQQDTIARKVKGEEGLGRGVFEESEGPELRYYVESIFKKIDHDGVTAATADDVINIVKHAESGSFEIEPNGHRADWQKIATLSSELKRYRPEAHFVIGAWEQGFSEAQRASQRALSSGFVIRLVRQLIATSGSARLEKWIDSLSPAMQRELESIIVQSAEYFWDQIDDRGFAFIEEWVAAQEQNLDADAGQRSYNGLSMREQMQNPPPEDALSEAIGQQLGLEDCIEPEVAAAAMQAVLDAQESGAAGRKPFRTQEVMRAFAQRGFGAVTVEDLEREFEYDPNSKVSLRKKITNTISVLNGYFEELELDVKIESERITVYRFCRRTG